MSSFENDQDMTTFAARLRVLRMAKGWTVTEMAEKAGLPRRSLDNYMKKDDPQSPGLEALAAIAAASNVSLDWLIRGEEGLATIRGAITRQAWEALKYHELKSIKFLNSVENPEDWTSDHIASVIATEIGERSTASISRYGNFNLREKQYRSHSVERVIPRERVPFDHE